MAIIVQWPKHVRYNCAPGCERCSIDACMSRVLFTCRVCGASEGELTKDCPARRMTPQERADAYADKLDYVGGAWVTR